MTFTLEMIQKAHDLIRPYIYETPMIRLAQLDAYLGCQVYAKADCMQVINAFKIRGAMNMILSLDREQLKNGIVTASSGNHGRGCAYAAKRLGIPAVVVIPEGAPAIKVENVRALGAEVVQCPAIDRFNVAARICEERGSIFIPPYDDERIMAGQGTAGIEIINQLPDADTVVVPLSGGGLLSGIATAVKGMSSARMIGAEPANIPRYTKSLEKGEPVEVPQLVSIADALVSNHPGNKCFPVIRDNVDEVAAVDEFYIKQAQKLLAVEGKIFAEASACIGIGALLQGKFKVRPDEKVCFFISGGNCSLEQFEILYDIPMPEPLV